MQVSIRLFAGLRERAGTGARELELREGATVADVWAALDLGDEPPGLLYAVNKHYATSDTELGEGDELALIPPVSGGSTAAAPWVRVSAEPLSLDALAARVRDPRAGAVVTFSGVTRAVERLEYEAYAEMAEERMRAIAEEALETHGLCAVAVAVVASPLMPVGVARRAEPDPGISVDGRVLLLGSLAGSLTAAGWSP